MGYFPRWTPRGEGIVAPDERLPWPQTVAMGVQHVVAMFGATVLAPLLMGFDPNVAILMSGIGTLIFFVVVGGRVPSYLGSSFAFIGVVIAATGYAGSGGNPNIGFALGGIVVCGARLRADRAAGHGDRHALDRVADAAAGDGRRGRGDRAQPRADRREGRHGDAVRRVDRRSSPSCSSAASRCSRAAWCSACSSWSGWRWPTSPTSCSPTASGSASP